MASLRRSAPGLAPRTHAESVERISRLATATNFGARGTRPAGGGDQPQLLLSNDGLAATAGGWRRRPGSTCWSIAEIAESLAAGSTASSSSSTTPSPAMLLKYPAGAPAARAGHPRRRRPHPRRRCVQQLIADNEPMDDVRGWPPVLDLGHRAAPRASCSATRNASALGVLASEHFLSPRRHLPARRADVPPTSPPGPASSSAAAPTLTIRCSSRSPS